MKFDEYIKKAFVMLEAGENPAQPPTQDSGGAPTPNGGAPSASNPKDLEKAGKSMSDNVENAEDALAKIAKRLIYSFRQILQTNDISERTGFLDKLDKAVAMGKGNTALQELEKVCDEYFPQAEPQEQ